MHQAPPDLAMRREHEDMSGVSIAADAGSSNMNGIEQAMNNLIISGQTETIVDEGVQVGAQQSLRCLSNSSQTSSRQLQRRHSRRQR